MKKTETSTGMKVLLNVLLIIYAVFALFPLVWMVLLSFKSDAQMYNTMFVFSPTLDNYRQVLFKTVGTACINKYAAEFSVFKHENIDGQGLHARFRIDKQFGKIKSLLAAGEGSE